MRPEEVLSLTAPTADFLCSLKANRYGIEFLEFRIQEQESKRVMFELRNAAGAGARGTPRAAIGRMPCMAPNNVIVPRARRPLRVADAAARGGGRAADRALQLPRLIPAEPHRQDAAVVQGKCPAC